MLNTILPGKETVFMSSKMEQIIEEIEDYRNTKVCFTSISFTPLFVLNI